MLIPIGHENTEVRRLPWVTITVIVLCTTLLWYTETKQREVYVDLVRLGSDIEEYYWTHTYLELDPEVAELLMIEVEEPDVLDLLERRYPWEEAEQQLELDQLADRFLERFDAQPFRRLGLNPASLQPSAWLTHMFTHAGILHLLGNMFLLFLAGACIEDVWGRPLYGVFYLVAGVTGAAFHMFMYPGADIPLVGASGAVSGVLGAFLVRYWSTRIRFFYWFFFFVRGTFRAPAWLMLPLWFGNELLNASVMDALMPGGGGVAHWAHVGGFAFGVVGALAIRKLRIEERFIRASIDSKVTLVSNEAIDRALDARAKGNPEVAYEILSEELRQNRSNYDAALAMWDIARELGRTDDAAPAMAGVVRHDVKNGNFEQGLERVREMDARAPSAPIEPLVLLRLGNALVERGMMEGARLVLRKAVADVGAAIPTAVALRLARLARDVDPEAARRAARVALDSPELDPVDRVDLERLLAELGGPTSSEPVASEPVRMDANASEAIDPGGRELGAELGAPEAEPSGGADVESEPPVWELDSSSDLDADLAETVCELPEPPGARELDLKPTPLDEDAAPGADLASTQILKPEPASAPDATQLFERPPVPSESDQTQFLPPDAPTPLDPSERDLGEAVDATVLQLDLNDDDFLESPDSDDKED